MHARNAIAQQRPIPDQRACSRCSALFSVNHRKASSCLFKKSSRVFISVPPKKHYSYLYKGVLVVLRSPKDEHTNGGTDQPTNRVALYASDPWDFVTENGRGPFLADIVRTDFSKRPGVSSWLVKLMAPLGRGEDAYTHALVSARHVGDKLEEIYSGRDLPTNVQLLTTHQLASDSREIPATRDADDGFIGSMRACMDGKHS